MKKKDILFLCQYFYPENNSSATLPFDTAKFFVEKGYCVDALCGYPKEYTEEKRVSLKETVEGVHIHRMRYLQLERQKKLGRLVNYLSFTLAAVLRLFKLRKYKCVIVYSNPTVLPVVPILANMLWKTKFIFVAYDVYPEIAHASGDVRPGDMIDRGMKVLNRMLYKRVSRVVALTDEMKECLLKNREQLTEDRVATIPNWAHEETKLNETAASRVKHSENDKFVVAYLGNMGICQDMETLCGAIERLKNHPKIQFLFAGHGGKYDSIKERFADYKNVECRGFLTGDDFRNTLEESTCAVVSLEKGIKGLCAPSKYYSYLHSTLPVIVIAEEGSYLLNEVADEKIGMGIEIGDVDHLVNVINDLSNAQESLVEMRKRLKEVYTRKYTKACAMKKYEQLYCDICSGR